MKCSDDNVLYLFLSLMILSPKPYLMVKTKKHYARNFDTNSFFLLGQKYITHLHCIVFQMMREWAGYYRVVNLYWGMKKSNGVGINLFFVPFFFFCFFIFSVPLIS